MVKQIDTFALDTHCQHGGGQSSAPLQGATRMKSSVIEHLARAGRLDRMFIGGEWVLPAGQARSAVIDPSTEEAIAEIALGSAQDVAVAVSAARRAFASWSVSSPQSRAALLDRVHGLILQRADSFAEAISLEMGAAITTARGAQVPNAAEHIRVARDLARSFPFVTHRGSTAIVREAIGVCGLITPWNWPLYQITAKVGPALAAGCTVVLKPSELSPLSALLFAEVVQDAGFRRVCSTSSTAKGRRSAPHWRRTLTWT
jgi:aldehyde dehydrogenase (NAD+)